MMCNKIDMRIECRKCGYPYSEARYEDTHPDPLPCDLSYDELERYINGLGEQDDWRNT